VSAVLAIASVACFAVAIMQKGAVYLPSLAGAESARAVGEPAFAGKFSGTQFAPFHTGHPYLWIGLGVGLLIGAAAVLLTAPRPSRGAS
jgi:hypothetical protein